MGLLSIDSLSRILILACLFLTWFHFSQEGSSHDRGLYARCFEELFDLANSDSTSTSKFNFSVTAFDLYNEQVSSLFSLTIYLLSLLIV